MGLKIGGLSLPGNLLLAPLAGITTLPCRLFVREFTTVLAFTEMVSAEGLVRGSKGTFHYLTTAAADHPLGVQIFGADPATMAHAAGILADHPFEVLDINMGCPVPKVTRSGAGAALMKNPRLIGKIVREVRRNCSLPLTVKIRSGWDHSQLNAVEVGLIAQENGADAITIHARTARQGFSGQADWEAIARLKEALTIPVIGNGDVRSGQDAARMLAMTRCDGVMIGRGALGNPWIFADAARVIAGGEPLPPPTVAQRIGAIERHYELTRQYAGPVRSWKDFRPHLLWYSKGVPGGAELRRKLSTLTEEPDLPALLAGLFGGRPPGTGQ